MEGKPEQAALACLVDGAAEVEEHRASAAGEPLDATRLLDDVEHVGLCSRRREGHWLVEARGDRTNPERASGFFAPAAQAASVAAQTSAPISASCTRRLTQPPR